MKFEDCTLSIGDSVASTKLDINFSVDPIHDLEKLKEELNEVCEKNIHGGLLMSNNAYGHYKFLPRVTVNCSDEPSMSVAYYKERFADLTGIRMDVIPDLFKDIVVYDYNKAQYVKELCEEIFYIFSPYLSIDDIIKELVRNGFVSLNGQRYVEFTLEQWIIELVKNYEKRIGGKSYSDFKEENIMGLKIRKTDVLSVKEFEESEKGYDEIIIKLDSEKVKEYESDYGVGFDAPYEMDGDDLVVRLSDQTIEFMPKAIRINGLIKEKCVPYDYIKEIVGVYYLTRE